MIIDIPYGKDQDVTFELKAENFSGIIEPCAVEPAADPLRAIEAAIDSPIGTPSLKEIVQFDRRVNIICDDLSRPTPVHLILPILIRKLKAIGVRNENIKIVMALGSHRYMTEEEMKERVGEEIYREFKVVNSEFKKEDDLVELGVTADGVEIYACKEAMDSEIRIGIGNIVPHPVMGWSGGAKILFPGVTGEKTVAQFHIKGGLADENLFGLEDCPIRLNMENWVPNVGLDFIINTVLTTTGEIYKVVAGDYVQAQRQGVEYAKIALGQKVEKKVDIVVVSSFPADQDLWQSPKAMFAAEHALKKEAKGTIILVSPNYEGIGPHAEYPKFFGMDDAEEILLRLYHGEEMGVDPLAVSVGTAMSKMRQRVNLIMVSDGVTKEEMDLCKIGHYPLAELQRAIDETIAKYEDASVAVVRHGGELFIY